MAKNISPKELLKEAYPARPSEVKKYDYGLMLVIGGSEFYSGAPALSALAGFRAGVDMVRIIAPKRAADIIASFSPILASIPLQGEYLSKTHVALLVSRTIAAEEVAHEHASVVIGGGLGRTESVHEAVVEYLLQVNTPVVIDADAIHAVAKKPEVLQGKPFLLTPHRHEFFVLTGREVSGLDEKERQVIVEEEARRLGTTILLKGAVDIVSNGEDTFTNTTGSPYLSGGGTGDTLAGIAGALLARNIAPVKAGVLAAYINGLAGEAAAKTKKESLVATDLIDSIPQVLS